MGSGAVNIASRGTLLGALFERSSSYGASGGSISPQVANSGQVTPMGSAGPLYRDRRLTRRSDDRDDPRSAGDCALPNEESLAAVPHLKFF